ncbi:MAG: hypothetical protein AAB445_00375 [Patescibacteria group bacterium]
MMLFLRALPAILAAWLLAALAVAMRVPGTFWIMLALAVVVPIFGLRLLTRRATLPRKFGALALFPALATLGGFGVLLFSESAFFQGVISVSLTFLLWLTWEQAFRFTHQPARYQKNALTNLAQLSAIAAFFFFTLVLFDLTLFASLTPILLVALYAVFSAGWFFGLAYLVQADRTTATVFGLLTTLIGTEFLVLLQRLPPLPAVKAGIMVIIIGAAVQLLRRHLEPQEKPSWWPFGVLALVLLCLVVTARWFA